MGAARRARALLALVALAVATLGSASATPAAAATARAGVIVDTGANVYTRVISFDGTISGLDALRLAGANPVTTAYAGQGAAVCQLFGVGNDPSSCLVGPGGAYWAYFRAPAGATSFSYSSVGAGTSVVHDGDVEGWRYGTGAPPPFTSFCDLAGCAPPTTAAVPPVSATTPSTDGSGGAATPAATATTAPAGATDTTLAPSATTSVPTSTTVASGSRAGARAAAAPKLATGGGDTGSPVGVVIVGVVVAGVAGAAVVLRRRRATPP